MEKNEKKYIIYMHKNKINGKMYIGQTCQTLEQRAQSNGIHYKPCTVFYRAIQKYGWNNFEHIILKDNLTLNEANYWEEYYIKFYHTWVDDPICNGYNLKQGGCNRQLSQVTKDKIRLSHIGKKASNETKRRKSEAVTGAKNPRARKIKCLNNNKIFLCAKDAADWCKVDKSGICKCAKGKQNFAGKDPITKEPLKWIYIDN